MNKVVKGLIIGTGVVAVTAAAIAAVGYFICKEDEEFLTDYASCQED